MMNKKDLFTRLKRASKLPQKQQRLCRHMARDYQSLAFQTVQELSLASGVSPATIVRTVSNLGYGSYRELQEEIRQGVLEKSDGIWWQLASSLRGNPGEGKLERVAAANVEALGASLNKASKESFEATVELLDRADKIIVLGTRSSRSAASYFYSMAHQFLPKVQLGEPSGGDEIYSQLLDCSAKDVLLAISVGGPHWSSRTINAVREAHRLGVSTVLLSSGPDNPAAEYASEQICVAATKGHYSLVPVMTVIDALVLELGSRRAESSIKRLKDLEKILTDAGVTTT